jgi:RNA polymerase sigma-70 factor (ECF subfamily)
MDPLSTAGNEPGADAPPSSRDLLVRARDGHRSAIDALFARHLPSLQRWAHGRLPRWARRIGDTADLVQESVISVFGRIETFEPRREGAFRAYLRQTVMNRIRDQYRRCLIRPMQVELDSAHPAEQDSPLEIAIGSEATNRYLAALDRLRPDEREVIVARIELGYGYEQIATLLRKPTANAARVALRRALTKLAQQMAVSAGDTPAAGGPDATTPLPPSPGR